MKFIDAFRMHMRPAGDGHNRSLCGKVRRYLRKILSNDVPCSMEVCINGAVTLFFFNESTVLAFPKAIDLSISHGSIYFTD
ncbi:hypothetical protein KP509_14G058000 [Ceratopteris richardii]|uniref:Uncharacterized protein n=1 Tax=Ceratopteris richardii TaxID=49495 RepID=A0A8T2T9U4_CERRI|nr:hypothetical protein KP509_14G058000 [Ceratopteris richardii]